MFVLVPAGDLSSQSSDTLMSLRTTPIPQVVSVGSAGVRYPAGSGEGSLGFGCAPRAWRTGVGEGCRLFSLLLGGSLHPQTTSHRSSECNPGESLA